MTGSDFQYLPERVDHQLSYFERRATQNQRWYKTLKTISIVCSVLTTMAIALAFTVSQTQKVPMGIVALVLSGIVLATYQWEEFYSYGAKWERFRLAAERLKSEKFLFLNKAGRYAIDDEAPREQLFVETIEGMIRGTDISYFSLMVEPGRRIEKRLESLDQQ